MSTRYLHTYMCNVIFLQILAKCKKYRVFKNNLVKFCILGICLGMEERGNNNIDWVNNYHAGEDVLNMYVIM